MKGTCRPPKASNPIPQHGLQFRSAQHGRRGLESFAQLKDDGHANKSTKEPPASRPAIQRRAALLGAAVPCLCAACIGGRAAKAAGRNPLYDKYFAAAMRYAMGDYEAIIRPVKSQVFGELVHDLLDRKPGAVSGGEGLAAGLSGSGAGAPARVLEVGIGAGPNFQFYTAALAQTGVKPRAVGSESGSALGEETAAAAVQPQQQPQLHIVGLDPNPEMLRYAEVSARDAGMNVVAATGGSVGGGSSSSSSGAGSSAAAAAAEVSLVQGSAEALPFGDGEFDAAVVTLVLCSVPSPATALAELQRVVRPAGRLLLIEHVAAGQDRPRLRLAQSVLTPLQRLLADGCSLNRDTAHAVRAAGWGGELRSFDLEGLTLLAPHIAGVLVR